MKKNIFGKFAGVSRFWWIFLAILVVGIFLRTYQYHNWLRFNADQGRDAELVSNVIDGKTSLPLLGPKAGGTDFKLGPVFYYFEIASAKIFGNAPDKMAYPDLFTGILCIPLLFLFLRKYFDQKIAIFSSAIFAVSAYAISYSRFAWNPNSTPFWSILALLAIHNVISVQKNHKYWWSVIAGLAIGVGIQLHTTLLLFLPITAILVFGYYSYKNINVLKYFFVILVMALFLNVPQFIQEYQHHGENVKAFFAGVGKKQESVSFIDKFSHGSSCWVQGNLYIISGYEISDTCKFKPQKNKNDSVAFIVAAIFIVGGMLLGIRYLQNETDSDKKSFLAIVYTYVAISFIVFIQLAFELSVRFYLILIFFPFLLLGFWWKFIQEKIKEHSAFLPIALVIFLIGSNLYFDKKYFTQLASYQNKGGTVNVVILSQVEDFANFIVANSAGSPKEIISGNEKFLFKAFKPMLYLTSRFNLSLFQLGKKESIPDRYFYIARSNKKDLLLIDPGVVVVAHKTHGKFTILLLEKK